MTAKELADKLGGEAVNVSDADINGLYAGDFLSRVMGKAPSGCAWLTVMNNVNVAGVAVLADIGAIVLCEGVRPIDQLTDKCKEEGISLVTTGLSVVEAVKALI